MKRPAFTLIELLVTTTVLSVLSGLTLATFAGLARLQSTRTRSQDLATSVFTLERQIQSDYEASSNAMTFTSAGEPVAYGFYVPVDPALPTGEGDWRIYCTATAGSTGKQVKRLRMTYTVYVPLSGTISRCSVAGLTDPFTNKSTAEEVLLGEKVGTLGDLRFTTMNANGSAAAPFLRIEGILTPLDAALDEDGNSAQNQLPIRLAIRKDAL